LSGDAGADLNGGLTHPDPPGVLRVSITPPSCNTSRNALPLLPLLPSHHTATALPKASSSLGPSSLGVPSWNAVPFIDVRCSPNSVLGSTRPRPEKWLQRNSTDRFEHYISRPKGSCTHRALAPEMTSLVRKTMRVHCQEHARIARSWPKSADAG